MERVKRESEGERGGKRRKKSGREREILRKSKEERYKYEIR